MPTEQEIRESVAHLRKLRDKIEILQNETEEAMVVIEGVMDTLYPPPDEPDVD